MVTPISFTREVTMQTTHITPEMTGRGAPRRELDLLFKVEASLGAVVLKMRMQETNSLPGYPQVPAYGHGTYEPHNVSSHFRRRLSDNWIESQGCDVLDIDTCYGDTGHAVAVMAWAEFMKSEEEGWAFLEAVYRDWRKP